MENQTRFDLSNAIQNWQQELAAQPNLTADTRRELETHVRDTVAELQRRGLNDEESFWLARRRVGPPNELGEEFEKAHPAKVSRERVLMIAMAFFAMYLWQDLANLLRWAIFPPISSNMSNITKLWVNQAIPLLLIDLPVAWLAVFVARGGAMTRFRAWRSLIRSRSTFLGVACILSLAIKVSSYVIILPKSSVWWTWGGDWGILLFSLSSLIWPAMLIALIVWLLPAEETQTFKRTVRG